MGELLVEEECKRSKLCLRKKEEKRDPLMPNQNQKLTLKPSHGTDMVDTMDTDTHTDTGTMVTILESDLLMLSQQLKLKLTPSHGTDMDIEDIMDIPIDTADTVVTTGDRCLCHQY